MLDHQAQYFCKGLYWGVHGLKLHVAEMLLQALLLICCLHNCTVGLKQT
jgi:hypothetical protein